MSTGVLGIVAARSRLRLYVLMIIYGIMDFFSNILFVIFVIFEVFALSGQKRDQMQYWITLASQLNYTKNIEFWKADTANPEEAYASKSSVYFYDIIMLYYN
jgi:type IV secretory pathway VirB3-like protein